MSRAEVRDHWPFYESLCRERCPENTNWVCTRHFDHHGNHEALPTEGNDHPRYTWPNPTDVWFWVEEGL